jgi:hypothetical protein
MIGAMNLGTEGYLRAVQYLREQATDDYDRAYWRIEIETNASLDSRELHRRAMRATRRK